MLGVQQVTRSNKVIPESKQPAPIALRSSPFLRSKATRRSPTRRRVRARSVTPTTEKSRRTEAKVDNNNSSSHSSSIENISIPELERTNENVNTLNHGRHQGNVFDEENQTRYARTGRSVPMSALSPLLRSDAPMSDAEKSKSSSAKHSAQNQEKSVDKAPQTFLVTSEVQFLGELQTQPVPVLRLAGDTPLAELEKSILAHFVRVGLLPKSTFDEVSLGAFNVFLKNG